MAFPVTPGLTMRVEVDTRAITRMYRDVPDALQRRHLRKSLMKAGTPVAREMRQIIRARRTPDTTGALGKAIGTIVRTNKVTLISSVRVGALRGKQQLLPRKTTLKKRNKRKSGKLLKRVPSKYFHLSDVNRDGKVRVRSLFAKYKTTMQQIIATELESALIAEAAKARGAS